MKYGLALPQAGMYDLPKDVSRIAQAAEEAGYASVWVYERVLFPLNPSDGMYGVPGLPWMDFYRECADALTVLTVAAAVTERVRLGTSVLVAPLHPPLQLARVLATLDKVSSGRVVAGFGSGWSSDEYRGMGADFGNRGRLLEETVDACRAFWAENPVSHHGSRATVDNSLVNPKPAAAIPVLLGGGRTVRAIDRIARKADGWLPTVLPPASAIAVRWRQILDLADKYGRDAEQLMLVPRAGVMLSGTPAPADRQLFQGSMAQVLEDVAAIAEIGADEVVLDLSPSARDGEELLDRSAQLREAVATAGL